MEDILEKICAYAKFRVEERQKALPFDEVKRQALALPRANFAFEKALKREGLSLVCEVKKASPSKGIIDPVFDYPTIARDYADGGADCISCLTEPKWFLGSDDIFKEIRAAVSTPMLRKDFTVSEYQIYESRLLGADAVLLILDALPEKSVRGFFETAERLGLSVLFECRSASQVGFAQRAGGRVIGVNNRNLRDFSVDRSKAASLRALVDGDKVFVSESGIASLEDLQAQRDAGADACLVGEFLMRAQDRRALLRRMLTVG